MHYDFPEITHIDDVTPFIDDCFIVKETDEHIFINYKNMSPETFPQVTDTRKLMSTIRREFRGIAFSAKTGEIISRPFHKFFNLGEREDETPDWDIAYTIEEKLDGSMVRPLLMSDGSIRWGTKAGITDVAMAAEAFVAKNPVYEKYSKNVMEVGLTPIFEFWSPDTKIVLDYDDPYMILLSVRNNITGEYHSLPRGNLQGYASNILVVPKSKFDLCNIQHQEDEEGIIIHFVDGHRVKVKSEWYVKLHRGKELVDNERRVVQMILDNTIDDVLPLLDVEHKKQIDKFTEKLFECIDDEGITLENNYRIVREVYETKKDFAILNKSDKKFRSAIFSLWDGKVESPEEYIIQSILKSMGTRKKYEEVKDYWKLPCLKN